MLFGGTAFAGSIVGPTRITSELTISTGVETAATITLNGTTGEIQGEILTISTGPSAMTGGLTVDGIAFPDQATSSASDVNFNSIDVADYINATELSVTTGFSVNVTETVMSSNVIKLTGLPTSDPGVDGQLYRSGTNIYISAGP